jgi:hypothetical protein
MYFHDLYLKRRLRLDKQQAEADRRQTASPKRSTDVLTLWDNGNHSYNAGDALKTDETIAVGRNTRWMVNDHKNSSHKKFPDL